MRRSVRRTKIESLLTSFSLAYDLAQLVSQRPDSVLNPTSTRLTSRNELEYLDVFDFFNYPRTRPSAQQGSFTVAAIPDSVHDVVRFDRFAGESGGEGKSHWLDFSRNGG